MTRRDHLLLSILAAAALALALFQCWYASLPQEEAAQFDLCRLSRQLDCFESLAKHGADLRTWGGVPVIPALAALLLFQVALALFAFAAAPAAREAWIALARVVSFPATGFAVYQLLSDWIVARTTSASAVLICALSLALNVQAIWKGVQGARLRAGLGGAALLAAGALLSGFFLHGSGTARREIESVLREREAAPPQVRWARFAHFVPRAGTAALGDPLATREVLLFVDPSQPASQELMRQAPALAAEYGDRVLLYLLAPGEAGARLLLAQRSGTLNAYLAGGEPPPGDPAEVAPLLERQQAARERLGIAAYPAALWNGGRKTGSFRLREVLEAALTGSP